MNSLEVVKEYHNNNLWNSSINLETSVSIKGSWTRAWSQAKLSAILSDVVETEQSVSATYVTITFWTIRKALIQCVNYQ